MSVKYVQCIHFLQNLHPTWCIFVTVLEVWRCPIPISAAIFLTVTHQFSLMSWMIFPLFLSIESGHMQTIWGRLMMSVFPSLKCFSHCLTCAEAFIHILKSWLNSLFRDFLLNKKFYHNMLLKHVLTSHFLALKYENVTSAGDVTVLH
jgi:hypothetical protein